MATFSEDIVSRGGLGLGGDGGGGILSGLILGALLGRGGLGGLGGASEPAIAVNVATKEDLILQTLGDVKASIPYNEAQVQLALAGAVTQINNQANVNTLSIQAAQNAAALAASTNAALIARDIAAVDTNVDRQSAAIQVAVKDSERNILEVLNQNRIRDLEQQLTVSQLRESENRAIIREQENSHNITVTQNNNQAQAQLQFQRQDQNIQTLLNCISGLSGQVARATNANLIVGNTGATTTGPQTANPVNVNA